MVDDVGPGVLGVLGASLGWDSDSLAVPAAQGLVLAANSDPRAAGHRAPSVTGAGSGASVGCRTASSPAFHAEA